MTNPSKYPLPPRGDMLRVRPRTPPSKLALPDNVKSEWQANQIEAVVTQVGYGAYNPMHDKHKTIEAALGVPMEVGHIVTLNPAAIVFRVPGSEDEFYVSESNIYQVVGHIDAPASVRARLERVQ